MVRKNFPKIVKTLVDIKQSEIHREKRLEVTGKIQKAEMQKKLCRRKDK